MVEFHHLFVFASFYLFIFLHSAWPVFGLVGGTYNTKTLESLVTLLQSLLRITAATRLKGQFQSGKQPLISQQSGAS